MRKINEKIVYKGRWIQLKEAEFSSDEGKNYKWEIVERVNRARGVVVIAELVPSHRIVFLRQYRQPLENYIIGFPAGLAESEDLGKEAMRELLEETGYYGEVLDIGPLVRSNPGLMDEGAYTIQAKIDENDPRNQNPRQNLEASEEIEVFLVPKESAREFVLERKAMGDEIGIGAWYLFGMKRI